ncbi:MAG: formylglycine-generating enzyme family protein [bacterium]|nr:formylglycine-generating enzyme family protein [bacterium]
MVIRIGDGITMDLIEVPNSMILMGKYPVTQMQWAEVNKTLLSVDRKDNFPITNVSWDGARKFCSTLSTVIGFCVRLPELEEWEFACKSITNRPHISNLDRDVIDKHVWYKGNSNGIPHIVGEKNPNKIGLYDMYGNVYEWCGNKGKNHPSMGWLKFAAGGCYCSNMWELKRPVQYTQSFKKATLGFRVVIEKE